jgi:4-hydroxy-tetrahydrodipicolinate reductase
MFTMHMKQAPRTCPFVQIVHILCDNQQFALPTRVEMPQRPVRSVGLGLLDMIAAHVVKAQDKIGVTGKTLGRCHILNPVLLPEAARVAERANPAFGGNACPCEDHDIADVVHRAHEAQDGRIGQVMTSIGIIGSEGRMGQALAQAAKDAGLTIAGGIDKDGDPIALAKRADVLLDFSSPGALVGNLGAAVVTGKPILVGTTGLEEHHHQALDDTARHVAVLQTGNTSLGVTLLARLVREAASKLGDEWDIEILEMHHRMKVDAPSGTATMLGEAAAAGRGIDLSRNAERGRDGKAGARARGAIGFASLRGGTIAGDHSVLFATDNERITLAHHAENRSIFARGAIRAASWLVRQPLGRYTMDHVIGM